MDRHTQGEKKGKHFFLFVETNKSASGCVCSQWQEKKRKRKEKINLVPQTHTHTQTMSFYIKCSYYKVLRVILLNFVLYFP